jgi:DNA-binding NtrC family response regulator
MSKADSSTPATDALERSTPLSGGCVIKVIEGPDLGREVDLERGAAVVGTKSDCQLRLSDSTVSGHHVRIEVTDEGLLATDLGSTNGTFYLETRLAQAVLQHGAVLKMGRTRLALASRQLPASPHYSLRDSYAGLRGSSPATRRLYAVLEQLEAFDYTILVLGETGVGKDWVARAIHERSRRARGPFEVCDCAALSANLIESELFGHARGAFTGAQQAYQGAFERADGGTIFLDEIGELPLDLQPKLLRVLETRSVRPVGSGKSVTVDTRVIAATNRDLAREVREGRFREDLLYRLNSVTVRVPPLRQRREDIPQLITTFLAESGQKDLELSPSTLELFTTGYDWPGNVRELKNAVTRVSALGSLPETLTETTDVTPKDDKAGGQGGTFIAERKRIVEAFERDYLTGVLGRAHNNISQAARLAGVERMHFKRLLKKHGIRTQGGEGAD